MTGPLDRIQSFPATSSVAVVNADGIVDQAGPDTTYKWASVTKLLTALAVLDAVQQGKVGLDDPAGPPGSTVRHLLAHTSGIGTEHDGVLAQPGRRRIYSNRGFEVLGEFVADRVGMEFGDWLAASVFGPLELTGTTLEGSPAKDAEGPIADLARFGQELLDPTIVHGHLFAEATNPVFPGLSGVLPGFGRQDPNDWGLGFELRDNKTPHWTGSRNSPQTFGHFGRSGSFLWVDPVAGLACAFLSDRTFGSWAAEAWPVLSDEVLTAYAGWGSAVSYSPAGS
jgi:CubicO group peptidase (beta-lactamase class C family)